MTFGTWKWWGQPHTPTAFTPQEMFLVLIFTRGWVDPRAMVRSEGNVSLKNPVTPPGIDPGTVLLVAQRLNHYATAGPESVFIQSIYNYYLCRNICYLEEANLKTGSDPVHEQVCSFLTHTVLGVCTVHKFRLYWRIKFRMTDSCVCLCNTSSCSQNKSNLFR